MSDLVRNPEDRFSRVAAHLKLDFRAFRYLDIALGLCLICTEKLKTGFLMVNVGALTFN